MRLMICLAGSRFAAEGLDTASMQHPALALSSRVLHVLSQIADSLACRRALVCLGRTESRRCGGITFGGTHADDAENVTGCGGGRLRHAGRGTNHLLRGRGFPRTRFHYGYAGL